MMRWIFDVPNSTSTQSAKYNLPHRRDRAPPSSRLLSTYLAFSTRMHTNRSHKPPGCTRAQSEYRLLLGNQFDAREHISIKMFTCLQHLNTSSYIRRVRHQGAIGDGGLRAREGRWALHCMRVGCRLLAGCR